MDHSASRRRVLGAAGVTAATWAVGKASNVLAASAENDPPVATSHPASAPVSPRDYLLEVTRLLQVDWPRNRTVNIVCHGHSVPAGYFKTPVVDSFNAYPHLLHRGLKERFPHAVINVIVTAIGGEESDRGAGRFQRDVLTHRPDVVTIDYSLNDRRIGLEKAAAAWTQMIQQAQAAKVKVLLLTPTLDQGSKLDDPKDPLFQHAGQVRELARAHGAGLVDSTAAFQRQLVAGTLLADLMSQSNHPNRNGHELVAAELLNWFPA